MSENPPPTENNPDESPKESESSPETEESEPETSEEASSEFDEISVDIKAPKLVKQCSLLLKGNLDGKQCKNPQNNKRVFGMKELHKRGKHQQEETHFYLKYFDENGYRQNIETDLSTAKEWYLENKQKNNLKSPIYKGNRKIYHFKKEVID